jgi:hypothetical protein
MKVILLNGPPRSGKDLLGELLRQDLHGKKIVKICKMADHLKRISHRMMEEICPQHTPLGSWRSDHFESRKDQPIDWLGGGAVGGMTPRRFYIEVSERFMKPLFGDDYFGRYLASRLEQWDVIGGDVAIVTDCGFRDETIPIVKMFGPSRVTLVRIRREGHLFVGDSRGYIDLWDLGVRCVDLVNPSTRDGFLASAKDALPEIFSPEAIK